MTNKIETPQVPIPDNDEIDLIALAKTLWNGRRTIIKYTVICAVFGLVLALITPKEYTSSTVMVPQTSGTSSSMGSLSSLASLAGVNLSSLGSSETLSIDVYPQIISSVPFQLELMNTKFQFQELDQPVTLYDYYTEYAKPGVLASAKKYTIGLPRVILKALKPTTDNRQPITDNRHLTTDNRQLTTDSKLLSLTEEQEEIRKQLSENIVLEINENEGYLSLSATFHEAALSAQITQKALEMLQDYVTRYKLEKASDQFDFIQERYTETKNEFENIQETLARFRDRNKNMSTAIAQTEEERLQSEYDIAFSVYSELASQLELARIQVKEDTPILTVIEPVTVPIEKSSPNRPLILFMGFFLGALLGVGVVFGKGFLADMKIQWSKS